MLFPLPSYYGYNVVEHGCEQIPVEQGVEGVVVGTYGRSTFGFLRILHTEFHSGYTGLQPLTSLPTFVVGCSLDLSSSV